MIPSKRIPKEDFKQRILDSVNGDAMNISTIMQRSGLKNWESAKALCLELVLQGKLQARQLRGLQSPWIFWK